MKKAVRILIFIVIWSTVFFGSHQILGAAVMIVLLRAMILETMLAFHKISRPAAFLLVPYFLWVSFATVLNTSLYVLNRWRWACRITKSTSSRHWKNPFQ